jgi:ABC-type transport system involved in multi-copper enzyme maturation permease subunit
LRELGTGVPENHWGDGSFREYPANPFGRMSASRISEISPMAFPAAPQKTVASAIAAAWNNARAIAGVVILVIYRRKDFYVLFVLTALITLVMGSVNFFNEDKIVRYLKEICLFLIWGSSLVIAITTTARQIPSERENRTLFPLLAKPVSRNHLILGKFLGCWLACGISLVVFYFFFSVISGIREHHWPLVNYFQALVLHWFMLGVVVSMTMFGSVVFAAPSSTNTITFIVVAGIMLLARHLNKIALQLDSWSQTLVYTIYYVIPHLEIFDVRDLLIHNGALVPWAIWAGALGYAAVYTAIFLVLTCLAFRRKAIN